MPLDQEIKLQTIKYKQFDNQKFLSGMQLEFSNGIKTPMFQAGMEAEMGWDPKTIKIDTTRKIAQISMNVHVGAIHGMRLIDDNGEYIMNVTWHR